MGTKKKASPRSSHLKGKLNDLIPQEHLDFYSKIYQRMENLRKQVPRVRQNEKYLSKRFREIHNLCEAGFLPEVSPFMSIWEWQKKNNPELTQLLLIERLKTREKSSDRSGAPPNFPINFLIYALIYELRQKTGKPHYKEVGDFLQEKEIRPLNVPKDDYLSESGIQKICKRQKQEEMLLCWDICRDADKDLQNLYSAMMDTPPNSRPFFFEIMRNHFLCACLDPFGITP